IVLNTFEESGRENVMGMDVDFVPVIHRYVPTEMHAFRIKTDEKSLFYMTDIDHWTEDAVEEVEAADVAIIDGCFWSEEEIDRYERVPHPPIRESLERFEDADTDIIFTHINHTNPVLDPESEERRKVEEAGFRIAEEGMEIEL
ncbi:MAG: MBL fold metallo-hydrolase, partial [Candidatus Nanohaloarchaea archaeon]|nr:MBL fold metallo-hydrolase [Candidatus Nanohaloarchaea archaeon]